MYQPAHNQDTHLATRPPFKPRKTYITIFATIMFSTTLMYDVDVFLCAICNTVVQRTSVGFSQTDANYNLARIFFELSPTNSVFIFCNITMHSSESLNLSFPTPPGPKTILAHVCVFNFSVLRLGKFRPTQMKFSYSSKPN